MTETLAIPTPTVALSGDTLDAFMPMHLLVDGTGRIVSAGRCWSRMGLETPVVGSRLDDLFRLRRPRDKRAMSDLGALAGEALHLSLLAPPNTHFRGILMDAGGEDQMWLINMSFGIDVAKAVKAHDLTIDDFAVTDLTVELLYLMEAHSLSRSISRTLIRRLEQSKSEAVARSLTDPLTGVGNRRALQWAFDRQIKKGAGAGLIVVDLDHFKELNDSLGHAAGDHMLTVTADRLREETRQNDFVARVGGDEFVVMMSGRVTPQQLHHFAERLIARIATPTEYRGKTLQIGASAGCVRASSLAKVDPEAVIEAADAALYDAKRSGRGRAILVDCPGVASGASSSAAS